MCEIDAAIAAISSVKVLLIKSMAKYHDSRKLYNDLRCDISTYTQANQNMEASLLKMQDMMCKHGIKFELAQIQKNSEYLSRTNKSTVAKLENLKEQAYRDVATEHAVLEKLSTAFVLVNEMSVNHICPICFTQVTSHFINPCGHTFCAACVMMMNDTCFMCKQHVDKVCRMYN